MTKIVRRALTGEIIPPGETVRVIGMALPFVGKRFDARVAAGLTVEESIREVLGSDLPDNLLVQIGGHVIERVNWKKVRAKPGAVVTFRPVLHGPNANIIKSVLAIAVAVAAMVIAPYAAGALFPALAAGSIGLTFATAVISTAIIFAGMMALNALFPARPTDAVESAGGKSLASIQGARNQSAPYQPIPVVLGRHRLSPFYGAQPYTELVGDDQYLRMLFVWGIGPLSIDTTTLKIGETPISQFSDYEIEHFEGYVSDGDVTLYPREAHELSLSIELSGSATAGPDDYWESRNTPVDVDEISIDITAPEGSFRVNNSTGNLDGIAIPIEARYRPVAGGAWTDFPDILFQRATSPVRKGTRVTVTRGQYEVQVRRGTAWDPGADAKNRVVWTALRTFQNGPPVLPPVPLAMTAIRIRATDQLSGVIDTLNGVVTSLVTAFDGVDWNDDTVSQNPADLFRHVLQGAANARARTDAQIDIENLEEWWEYCDDNGFEFNQVRTQRTSVYSALFDIAAAGRAVPTFIDGKWAVIWDRPDDDIVDHFTPRNSWDLNGDYNYVTMPHGWRVRFINEENGWSDDERTVYDDGYDESNATLFEGIDFTGVTKPSLVWKHGRFHIAQARLRPEEVTLQTSWNAIGCGRGDRVKVTHDAALIGLGSGRVRSVSGQNVTLDEEVLIESGKTYALEFRTAADASIIRAVDTLAEGYYRALPLVGDLSGIDAGDLFAFGETDQVSSVYRVKAVRYQRNLTATLVLVNDAPEISEADQGDIPPYNPNITLPPDPITLPPQNLVAQEALDLTTIGPRRMARLSWQAPRRYKIAATELQIRDDDEAGDWTRADTLPWPRLTADVALASPGQWSFRVRFLFNDDTASAWTMLEYQNFSAVSLEPASPTNVRLTHVADNMNIAFDEVQDYRPIRYEFRIGDTFEGALYMDDRAHGPFPVYGDGVYWVAAYVFPEGSEKIYSEAVSIDVENTLLISNILVNFNDSDDGWPGTFSGGVNISGDVIRTSGANDFLGEADFLDQDNFLDGDDPPEDGDYYSNTIVDIGRVAPCYVLINFAAAGTPVNSDFLGFLDLLVVGDFLGAESSQYVEVYPIIRVSQTDDIEDGEWVKYAPGAYLGRTFQPGMRLITNDETTNAVCVSMSGYVDVPDRYDEVSDLSVVIAGTAITFRPKNALADAPFNGGPNGEVLPHVQATIIGGATGDEVVISSLTLSGCTVRVRDSGGSYKNSSGVNLAISGY